MNHRDWFGILVRGFYLLIQILPQCVALIIDYQNGGPGGGMARAFGAGRSPVMIYCLVYLVLGFIFLRFPNAIVRFAYPREREQWVPPIEEPPPVPRP